VNKKKKKKGVPDTRRRLPGDVKEGVHVERLHFVAQQRVGEP
jgi:hypothetical protein